MRYLLLALLLTACTALPSRPSLLASMPVPVSTPAPDFAAPIADGLRFLRGQYSPDYGLLQESPNIGQHRYYLTNDNALAAYVFAQAGDAEMAERLRASLARYGYDNNGFIEVAWGKEIAWPPRHHKDIVVEQKTAGECDFLDPSTGFRQAQPTSSGHRTEETGPLADCVLQETHTDDLGFFYDWSSFSNLHCMGAVNEYNKGNVAAAQWLYEIEASTFDGHGWADEAWRRRDGVYETIGPAWCLYAGALLQAPIDARLLAALLAQQDPVSGGFHTHYRIDAPRLADANVETTALALLALLTLQNGPPPKPGGLGFPGGPPPNP